MESDVPPQVRARFRPRRRLAAGGYGTVWHAIQEELDREVALKVLHRDVVQDADTRARFESEARLTAGLRHENIVVVIDHGVEDGVPWIAYEYVPGRTLRDEMAGRPMRPSRALRFVRQVAAALEEAHRHGVVHRDIKPENLLVPRGDELKVADFGLARREDEARRTSAGVIIGTPGYIAPERIRGGPATPAGDVYAAGVLLFELLTGRLPFPGDTPLAMLERQAKEDPPPPSALAELPPEVDRLVLATLARDPGARTPSARALREAIDRLRDALGLGDEASTEAPPAAFAKSARTRLQVTQVATRPSLSVATGKARPLALTLAVLVVIGGAVRWRTREAPPPRPSPTPSAASPWSEAPWKAVEADVERLLAQRRARIRHWRSAPPTATAAEVESASRRLYTSFAEVVERDLATLDSLEQRIQQLDEGARGHPMGRLLEARLCAYRFILEHGRSVNRDIGRELAAQRIQTPADYMLYLSELEGRKLDAALTARLLRAFTLLRGAIELACDRASEAGDQLPRLFEDLRWLCDWVHQAGRGVSSDRAVEAGAFDLTWRLERMNGAVHDPAGRAAKGFWQWAKLGSGSPEGRRSLDETLEAMAALGRAAPLARPGLEDLAQVARGEIEKHERARARTVAH